LSCKRTQFQVGSGHLFHDIRWLIPQAATPAEITYGTPHSEESVNPPAIDKELPGFDLPVKEDHSEGISALPKTTAGPVSELLGMMAIEDPLLLGNINSANDRVVGSDDIVAESAVTKPQNSIVGIVAPPDQASLEKSSWSQRFRKSSPRLKSGCVLCKYVSLCHFIMTRI
jgi:hypothetical protein